MGAKRYDRILMKLNDLFLMNYQVGKSFSKVHNDVIDDELKLFFKEKTVERNQFGELLQAELNKLGAGDANSLMLNRRNHLTKLNFKKLLHLDDDGDLFKQVYKVMQLSIEKYNELLMEMHLPLSLCKLLIKQRDHIQTSFELIKREAAIVVYA